MKPAKVALGDAIVGAAAALASLVEWAEVYREEMARSGERPAIDAGRVKAGRKALDRIRAEIAALERARAARDAAPAMLDALKRFSRENPPAGTTFKQWVRAEAERLIAIAGGGEP